MSTGAAYCQLTHLLFRDAINLRKWFFKFFNANYVDDGEEYDALAARGGEVKDNGGHGAD
ncbi:hypothetical protein OSTOST_22621 [Ostertagia ostertagi]